jgi:hypothetical protein
VELVEGRIGMLPSLSRFRQTVDDGGEIGRSGNVDGNVALARALTAAPERDQTVEQLFGLIARFRGRIEDHPDCAVPELL